MIGEVIQEYLVSLGVKIDKPGFQQLNSTIGAATQTIDSATGRWAKSFTTASTVIVSALAGITTASAGVMKATASQDLAMEKLARRMMVSKDAAWSMKQATDALGESISDIAITPELMERYQKLVADGKNMKVGGDFAETMRGFRDLMFEFTRLKQEVSYALTWVGYYLLKYLNRPLAEAQARFRSFNDSFIRNMSAWTEKLARAAVYIINIGLHFFDLIKSITSSVYELWNAFPRGVKIATAAITVFFTILKMSPLGRMITLVSALLLLVDDYFGYFEGKQALFGKYWEKLRDFIDGAKQKIIEFAQAAEPIIETCIDYLFRAVEGLQEFGRYIMDIAERIGNSQEFQDFLGVMEELGDALYELGHGIIDVLASVIDELMESFENHDSASAFTELMHRLWDIFLGLIRAIAQGIRMVAGWLEEISQSETVRDFVDACGELLSVILELIDAVFDLVTTVLREFFGDMVTTEPVYGFRDAVRSVVRIITAMIRAVSWVIRELAKFFKMMASNERFREFWRGLGRAVKDFMDIVMKTLRAVGKLGEALIALMKMDFSTAKRLAMEALGLKSGSSGSRGGSMAQKAWALSQEVGAHLGVDPALIYGQAYHETSGFTSALAREDNNFGGIKDNSGNYMTFDSMEDYFAYFEKVWGPYIKGASSPEDYVQRIQAEGYFEAGYDEYLNGVKNGMNQIPTESSDDYEWGSGSSGDFGKTNLQKYSSANGYTAWDDDSGGSSGTDTNHFQPRTAAFLDTLNAAAREAGITFTITGGAEPGHASGTYSHSNGWKVDISDDISATAEQVLLKVAEQYDATVSHELDKGHYDITIKPEGEGTFENYNSFVGGSIENNPLRVLGNRIRRARRNMRRMAAAVDPVMMNGISANAAPVLYGVPTGGITYQITVGDVNVAQTNASPEQIGKAVADKSLEALQRRGQYVLQNRTLTGGPNVV